MIKQTFPKDIAINVGKVKRIEVANRVGNVHLYEYRLNNGQTIITGFTNDPHLIKYHPQNDPRKSETIRTLESSGIETKNGIYQIGAVHGDLVLIDKDGACDGIVSSKIPITLAPADCNGIMFIFPKVSKFSLIHAGRAGIEFNIINKLSKKIENPQDKNIIAVLGPQIACNNYPHDKDDFRKGWWLDHPECIHQDGKYFYPDIANAAIAQIKESFPNANILASGIDTFDSSMASHKEASSQDKTEQKPRNLYFIGLKKT